MNNTVNCLLVLLALMPSCYATTATYSAGLQAGSFQTAYRSSQPEYWLLPYFGVEADPFYIDGTEASWAIQQDNTRMLKARVFYLETQFRASQGDTPALQALNSRHSTLMAGVTYQHITPAGALSASVSRDTLGISNGITANVTWMILQSFNNLTIVPAAGLDWWDARQSRYYYGINASESRRSGLPEWRPGASLIPFMQVGVNYDWKNSWNTWAQFTERFYTSGISGSPLAGHHVGGEFALGLSFSF